MVGWDTNPLATRDLGTALALADFRWLWIGSLASSFAMNMQIVARGWLVYTLTSSALDLAWVTLSFMIPMVAFALVGGVMADRVPKRGIIMLAQGMNSVATILLGVIILAGQVDFWDFIWFGFFNGTVLALSMPARQAMVPELVPERLIFTAMGLTTTSWNLSRILGPAMAGFLIAWIADGDTTSHFGVGIVYFMIAALYLASSLAMWRVAPSQPRQGAEDQHPLRDIADGMRYLWANPPVLGLILLSIVPFLFGMPLNTLLPAFNEDILSWGRGRPRPSNVGHGHRRHRRLADDGNHGRTARQGPVADRHQHRLGPAQPPWLAPQTANSGRWPQSPCSAGSVHGTCPSTAAFCKPASPRPCAGGF